MKVNIGIDVGNYDTKTQHTKTPSGYSVYEIIPSLSNEYLKYEGRYYAPTVDRFEYVKDKTENDQALILTLFGIAKEIMYVAKERAGDKASRDVLQDTINEIDRVSIAVGLPVGDFTKFKDKTTEYYMDRLGIKEVQFEYCGYKYAFKLEKCITFPQDLLPVAANPSCHIAQKYKKYLIIGIGGQTVDVIPVINNVPKAEKCISLRMGVRRMFSDIISKMETNFGSSIGEDTVEEALMGEETILSDEMEVSIREAAKVHTDSIINACTQRGFNFGEYPVVFFGGGGLLLQPYLENNKLLQKIEFLQDVNGNAKYYAARLPE